MSGKRAFYLTLACATCFCTSALAQFVVTGATTDVLGPAPAPSKTIELTLEDPRTPESKCYLDLDSGKVFTWGESTPDNALQSRRWRADNGVDLMSESRFPAEGLATYDLVLLRRTEGFDTPREYEGAKKLLEKTQSEIFSLTSVGADLPVTYVFRTKEGKIGVLEVTELGGLPSGVKLRYRMIDKPLPPVPPMGSGRVFRGVIVQNAQPNNGWVFVGNGAFNAANPQPGNLGNWAANGNWVPNQQQPAPAQNLVMIANRIDATQKQLELMRKANGENDPAVTMLRMQLAQLQQTAALMQVMQQTSGKLSELRNERFELEIKMQDAAKRDGFGSPKVQQLRRQADQVEQRMDAFPKVNRVNANDGVVPRPATRPAPAP